MMSDPTTVDRATIDRATGKVVLIIKEDRPWNDPETMHRELRSKVKRYVRYIRSEEFASEYGREPGDTLIRLVCSDPPDDATMDFLGRVRYELGKLGVGFDHRVEWFSDETAGERPLTVEGWEARTRFGREFDDSDAEAEPGSEREPESELDEGLEATETGPTELDAPRPDAPAAAESEAPAASGDPEAPAASEDSEAPSASEGPSEPDDLDVPAPPEGFQPSEREKRRETDPGEADPGPDPFESAPEDAVSDQLAPSDEFTPMMGEARASPDMFDDIDHELIEEPGIEAPEGLETGPPGPVPEAESPDLGRPDTTSRPTAEPAGASPSDRAEAAGDEEPDAIWPAEEFGDMGPDLEDPAGSESEETESGEAEIEILAGDDDGEEIWQGLSAVEDRETAARVATEVVEAEETAPSVGRALGAALATSIAFAVAWGLLAVAAGQPAGPVAVPLGLAVGFRVRLRGAGRSFGYRLIGGLGALLGCAAGSLLATVGLLTVSEGLDVPTLLERFAGARTALDTLGGFYGLTDLGIYVIAILLSFWLSAARKSE